jgi:hypothetical protein
LALGALALPGMAYAATKTVTKHTVTASCATPKNSEMARCFALRLNGVGAKAVQPNDAPPGYGPTDLHSAYKIPDNGGAGTTVAIVDANDDPNIAADLAAYRQQFGLAPLADGQFQKVSQRGGTDYPAPDPGWATEISIDVEMVTAVAPNAKILLVEADSAFDTDLDAAEDESVTLGAKFVSNSWGSQYDSSPGSGEDPSEVTEEDPHFNHPGVAVVASSGDSLYGVSYPAASQYVTSVGGTSLAKDESTRGWTESVWNSDGGGPGSGCSLYEPKPAFQNDTGCARRTVADVSAVADPETGVAVYDSYQQPDPWGVWGGTSVAAPIITAVYADAGNPAAGTYPNSYPYEKTSSLNDVTTGSNGSCTPAYLCNGAAGYNGPTGLGTPSGIAAFQSGPHGTVSGTVTSGGTPVAGAKVAAGDASTTTGTDGKYELGLPVGTYTVTASAYGYASKSVGNVVVADGKTVTEAFSLTAVPSHSVSGTITDGSGHAWPLYATITADGVPGGPAYSDPTTGRFDLSLAEGSTYTLHVVPDYPGYQAVDTTVTVKKSDITKNIKLKIDTTNDNVPGYSLKKVGTTEPFDGTTTPTGWKVVDNNADGGGWEFDDPNNRSNLTGGTGGFAIVDSDFLGPAKTQDTDLLSPTHDLSKATVPELSFDTDYEAFPEQSGEVDVSTDGGKTWNSVWSAAANTVTGHVSIALPQAAKKSQVQLKFHFTGNYGEWWELDNVFVGNRVYTPIHGGLVVGHVTDANTKAGVVGATVSDSDKPADKGTTYQAPGQGDGFYWLFSSNTGSHQFAAAKGHYATASNTVNVATNSATQADFTLTAGQISLSGTSIKKTVGWGGTASATVTVKNTGGQPASVTLGEQPGGFQMQARGGAPLQRVNVRTSNHRQAKASKLAKPKTAASTPADDTWQPVASLPTDLSDEIAAVNDGKLYAGLGFDGSNDSANLYSYDADSGAWTKLASASDPREGIAAHGFIGGKLYVAGGWGPTGGPDAKTEVYDPATDSWSTVADDPHPFGAPGSAVLDGKLYTVGGCPTGQSCGATTVMSYDPATDAWTQLADYPEATSWEACGAIADKLYCAGGNTDSSTSKHAYVYDPSADAWSPIADLPVDIWGSAAAAANGKLLVSNGVINNSATVTNEGYAYDPSADSWTALPNSNSSDYRTAGALGFYKLGGNSASTNAPSQDAEMLPGYDQGGSVDVTWLSENPTKLTLAPGKSAAVTVSLDAGVDAITQPGTYGASITSQTDTPYMVKPIDVSLTVKPPATWGKVTGTVTGVDSKGNSTPIVGATVEIDSWATSYTLKTDKDGQYALWLDNRNNPLQMIVAKDGYKPQVKTVKVVKGKTVTTNFALQKD